MEAVYERALGSRGGSRVSYLDRLEADAGGQPIPVDVLVDAFLSSALRLTRKDSVPGEVFKQLIGRAFYEPGPGTEAFFRRSTGRRWIAIVWLSCGRCPISVRMTWCGGCICSVGIVAYAMAGKDLMRMTETYALADAGEPEAIMARLRPFVVAGFLAAPGGLSTGLATP